jgi:hypothetical protein
MTREYTDRLYEMLQDGLIDAESLVQDLLSWLSEDEVKEFAERNDYITEEDEE